MNYILLLLMAVNVAMAQEPLDVGSPYCKLRPFTSDGCSDFPDGTPEHPTQWQHCCVAHDIAYWAGGERALRVQADAQLRDCVMQSAIEVGASRILVDAIAYAMQAGVKIGGTAYNPTTYRWGYGWERVRGYAPLTDAEKSAVAALTPADFTQVPINKISLRQQWEPSALLRTCPVD